MMSTRNIIGGSLAAMLLASTAFAQTTATATTDLNLRSGPGPTHEILGVIPADGSVTVDGCVGEAEWCRVTHDGTEGWAFGAYLQTEIDAEPLVLTAPAARTEIRVIEERETGGATGAGGVVGAVAGAIIAGPPGALLGAAAGMSAGSAVEPPSTTVTTYVRENPVDTIYLDGEVVVGAELPDTVTLQPVPESDLTYTYVNQVPVIVEPGARRIIYIPR
jgi:hypothetical protein